MYSRDRFVRLTAHLCGATQAAIHHHHQRERHRQHDKTKNKTKTTANEHLTKLAILLSTSARPSGVLKASSWPFTIRSMQMRSASADTRFTFTSLNTLASAAPLISSGVLINALHPTMLFYSFVFVTTAVEGTGEQAARGNRPLAHGEGWHTAAGRINNNSTAQDGTSAKRRGANRKGIACMTHLEISGWPQKRISYTRPNRQSTRPQQTN